MLAKSGKTCKFDKSDFDLLLRFCVLFPRQVTTPPVITEACNLLDTLNRQHASTVFLAIRSYLEQVKESRSQSSHLATLPTFLNLGLADSSLFALAQQNVLILTDDLTLYGNIISRNLAAVNFNHLRDMNWNQ